MTAAALMFSKKGIAYAKKYLVVECEQELLPACEHGHPCCAQFKKGPCMAEMKELIKGAGKIKVAGFSFTETKLGPGVTAYVLGAC